MFHRSSFNRYNSLAASPNSPLATWLSMYSQVAHLPPYDVQRRLDEFRIRYGDYVKPILTPEGPMLEVECGENRGHMFVLRFCQGSKGPCIRFNDMWLTPNEFQYISGRESAKDWKRSIRHQGKSLKLLLAKGALSVHPSSCACPGCRISSPVNRGKLSTFNPRYGFESFCGQERSAQPNESDPVSDRKRKGSESDDEKEQSEERFSLPANKRMMMDYFPNEILKNSGRTAKPSMQSTGTFGLAQAPSRDNLNNSLERTVSKEQEQFFANSVSPSFTHFSIGGKDATFPGMFASAPVMPIHLNTSAMNGLTPLSPGFPHLLSQMKMDFYPRFPSLYSQSIPMRPEALHPIFGNPSKLWKPHDVDSHSASTASGSGSVGADHLTSDTSNSSSPSGMPPLTIGNEDDSIGNGRPLDLSVARCESAAKSSVSSKPTNPPPDILKKNRNDIFYLERPYCHGSSLPKKEKSTGRVKAETFNVPRMERSSGDSDSSRLSSSSPVQDVIDIDSPESSKEQSVCA